ncbi:MAG TPA: signal peptidase II [Acidobacteriota bacterium]|nr:signal peptidase II [Acidobacteriota bacterium]
MKTAAVESEPGGKQRNAGVIRQDIRCFTMMRKNFYFLTLIILAVDHLTKWYAVKVLAPGPSIEVIPGFLRFSYVENTGVAFGLFDSVDSVLKPYILGAVALAAIVIIHFLIARASPERKLLKVSLAVMLGGVWGNFIDRILRKFVVDFIEVHFRDAFHWPNFNIADSAITIGVILLLIDTFRNPETQKGSDQQKAEPVSGS